jgi:hypothetical protein
MKIDFNLSVLVQTKWYEFAVRFFLGGAISAAAGLIAKEWVRLWAAFFWHFRQFFLQAPRSSKNTKNKKRKKRESSPAIAESTRLLSTAAAAQSEALV